MKRLLCITSILLLAGGVFAQAPQKMSYQAVIRDASGNLVTSTAVGVKVSILQGSPGGTAVYVETQSPTTNANGLMSFEIGAGNVTSGSFSAINWSAGPYFIKTETDPSGGSNYTITGTSELLSVPYALHANMADSLAQATYAIGDTAMGGIVFYVNSTGTHGLVASLQDQSSASSWANAHDTISFNTTFDPIGQEYTDWRLPTKHEMDLMRQNLYNSSLGGLAASPYWTSISTDSTDAWMEVLPTGSFSAINKSATFNVRAVRSF